MKEEQFNILLEQYVTDMINKEDREKFLSLLDDPTYRSLLEKAMEKEWNHGEYEEPKNDEIGQLIELNVMQKIKGAKVVPMRRNPVIWIRKVVAVAIVLIFVAGLYYLFTDPRKEEVKIAAGEKYSNEVEPGSNKAVLTLDNGKKIMLDSSSEGILARQGGTRLDKKANGLLSYKADGETGEVLFNTVSTPKGGQYHLRFVDGTEVWLNAASSMRFPTAFKGNNRTVLVSGEAYFEVAHDAKKPFRVEVKGMQVEVLGTHFNINAYADEGLSKTTLVQGRIKILKGKSSAILSPGQQAQVNAANVLSVVKDVDTKEALAWKNGYFEFNNANIETVMKQVERWYDVDVVYEGPIPLGHINGEISRSTTMSKMIRILEASGIHCKIEGRKIIVMR